MEFICVVLMIFVCLPQNVILQSDRIKLTDVKTLTLTKGFYTTGRRLPPVLQLQCTGGSAGCSINNPPNVVQCYNRGTDGVTVQWECQAALLKTIKFGQLKVSCEGYDSSDDPYILAGSCGLKYSLENINNSNSSGAIAGGVVGGIILLCLIVCAIGVCGFCCCKRRKSGTYTPSMPGNPTNPTNPTTIINNYPSYPSQRPYHISGNHHNSHNNYHNSSTEPSSGFASTETR